MNNIILKKYNVKTKPSHKFLQKLINSDKKFQYKFDEKEMSTVMEDQLLDSWHDLFYFDREVHNYKDLCKKIYDETFTDEKGRLKYKINKKKLDYEENHFKPQEFGEILSSDWSTTEIVTEVFATYTFSYYDNALSGYLGLVETDKHNRYIVGEICDMLQEESNFYIGDASNITENDFTSNVEYLVTEYLSCMIGNY